MYLYVSQNQKWNIFIQQLLLIQHLRVTAPTCPHVPGLFKLLTLPFCGDSQQCAWQAGKTFLQSFERDITISLFELMWLLFPMILIWLINKQCDEQAVSSNDMLLSFKILYNWLPFLPANRWPHLQLVGWKQKQCSDGCSVICKTCTLYKLNISHLYHTILSQLSQPI